MEKIDNFYKKIHGSVFAILGVVIFFLLFIISVILYARLAPFSLTTKYISDLGAGPCPVGNVIFTINLILTSILMIISHIFFVRYLQKRGGNSILLSIALIGGVTSSIGLMMLGIFPKYTFEAQHQMASYIYFGAGVAYLIFYGITELKMENIPRYQSSLNFVVMVFYLLYLIFKILVKANTGFPTEIEKVTEWLMLFSTLFWFIEFGWFTRKNR
ncbi:MAG: DUF998 domain-containing protein [Candidatus Lokiarchaeota archaeon]|nr:DUF998 domain-containing protein [Candidatus Lokiarchaeota archaeon]